MGCTDCSAPVRSAEEQQNLTLKCLQVPKDLTYPSEGPERDENMSVAQKNALERITWCTEGAPCFTDPKNQP